MGHNPIIGKPEDVVSVLEKFKLIKKNRLSIPEFIAKANKLVMEISQELKGNDEVDHDFYFTCLGALALECLDDDFSTRDFVALLLDKHQKYGPTCIIKWGALGLWIRIDSKLERVKNMVANNMTSKDESIIDTIHDILGYCVLGDKIV